MHAAQATTGAWSAPIQICITSTTDIVLLVSLNGYLSIIISMLNRERGRERERGTHKMADR
jgi:hypothetical protein